MGQAGLTRGDVVVAALSNEYGKFRPCVVVQATPMLVPGGSAILCPLTIHLLDDAPVRPIIDPSAANGLHTRSQAMTDKIAAVGAGRLRERLGALSAEDLSQLDTALLTVLGLG